MTADFAALRLAHFSIGRVLKTTFSILKRNFLIFALAAMLFELLGSTTSLLGDATSDQSSDQLDWSTVAVQQLADIIIGGLTDAVLMYATLQVLDGKKASLSDLVGGLTFAVPIIAVNAIIGLPATCSSLLEITIPEGITGLTLVLAAGSIVLWTAWFVAAPVVAAERVGVLAALRRSAHLTKGERWAIFALISLVCVAVVGLDLVVKSTGGATFSIFASATSLVSWTLEQVVWAFFSAFVSTMAAVSYFALRGAREGQRTDEVARIFE